MKVTNCKYILIVLMALLAVHSSIYAQDDQKTGQTIQKPIPLDRSVRTGKLPNGFTYYIRHNEEPKNRVLMYLVNKAGSVLEDEDQRGLAHFMEHMSFNGTAHFPHNELVDYLQKAGVRFGADINAYTSFDETVYELPLPSDKPAILNKGMLILHDWAQSATLDPSEIDKERGVVLEEERLGRGAGERMQRQYWPVILENSRYAVRIPIGLDTILDNFKRPAIARFYHDWYRPDLQALIIVGDINADSLERVVKARFADLKNPFNERPRPNYTVPLNGKNQFITITDREMTATQAEVIIKHPVQPLKSAADYRRIVMQSLFNQMLAARFAELSRQSDPPFVEGSVEIETFLGGTSVFDASVQAKPGELEVAFKALWRETERVKQFGFTVTELERAKQEYLNSMETSLKEKDKTPSEAYVKKYQAHFLKGIAAPGIETEYKLTEEDLPGITLTDLNDLAKKYITGTDRDVLVLAPDKEKGSLPDEAIADSWMNTVNQEILRPYQDEVSTQPLLITIPVSGNIKTEERNTTLGITALTLSNGLKVVLKPTDFKNDEIRFSAFAPGGSSVVSDTDFQSAANAAGIVPAGGVGNYSLTQLNKYLEGKQLQVKPFIAERFEGISGVTTPKDLETAMQLIYAYFTEPRKDTAVFKGIVVRSKAVLANRASDPNSVFSDTVSDVLGNHNSRRTGPSLAKLSHVDLAKAFTIYKERFADAAGFTFTFVGNIDTTAIRPLLEKYLGGLPATHSGQQPKDLHIRIPEGKIEKTVYMGSEPKSTVLLVFSGKFDYSPENKVRIDALKECLQIRLLQRLREDESGVYSPGVFASGGKLPESRFSFFIQFGCAPQNVDKLIASTLDEIAKLRTDGPLPENVNKWRQEAKTSREPQVRTNSFWLDYINGQLQNGDELTELNNYNDLLDAVKPAELKAMADRYLSGDNYIRLVLMPENMASR
jgi:zinc protease